MDDPARSFLRRAFFCRKVCFSASVALTVVLAMANGSDDSFFLEASAATHTLSAAVSMEKLLKSRSWAGTYALPMAETEEPGYSATYRCVKDPKHPNATSGLTAAIPWIPRIRSTFQLLQFTADEFADRPYVGERSMTAGENPQLGPFVFYTYRETLEKVEHLGRALANVVQVPMVAFEGSPDGQGELKIVGIWARTRLWWRLMDFAVNSRRMVSVPLYDTLGVDSIKYIVQMTKMEVIALDASKLDATLSLIGENTNLKSVICFDKPENSHYEAYSAAGLKLYYVENLVEQSAKINNRAPDDSEPEPQLSDVNTIIFTSGTTGMPKGAVHTNESLLSMIGGYIGARNRMRIRTGDSVLSFLPLAHVYQRGVELMMTFFGTQLGYYSGDLLKLPEDLQALKPTTFIGVPRVYTKMLAKTKNGISEKPYLIRLLARGAMAWKLAAYRRNPNSLTSTISDMILSKVRNIFGGRLRTLAMGSAPMDSNLLTELQLYLSASIAEGWGMTETGVAFLQDSTDQNKGTVGGPLPCVEFRLASLPDMNYMANSDPPCGELLVRGPSVMKRYFLDPERTGEVLDADGWLRTGDVVELLPNGAVKIIDRAKNMFKLAQGEYISPERLENIYANSLWVDQIFVYGDPLQSSLVAVIVPSVDHVKKWAAANGQQDVPYEDIVALRTLNSAILTDLKRIGRSTLQGFEIIQAVYITPEPFTVENGLLTPTMKLVRTEARKRFSTKLSNLYKEVASASWPA